MHSLLLRLAGPMQSWGTRSMFDQRDTDLEPSKSGVVGLLCAALGVNRLDEERTLELAALKMAVRVDREGTLRRDYQTAHSTSPRGVVSTVQTWRYYLADAVFLVALEGDAHLLERTHAALQRPCWALALGRKSYLPSPGVWLPDGLAPMGRLEALRPDHYPFLPAVDFEQSEAGLVRQVDPERLRPAPLTLRVINESDAPTGSLRMDQPISSFAERRFGARFVQSSLVEVNHVPK